MGPARGLRRARGRPVARLVPAAAQHGLREHQRDHGDDDHQTSAAAEQQREQRAAAATRSAGRPGADGNARADGTGPALLGGAV
ncbi:hypothetical protein [Brachybacterium sp. GPGPB12]|uniref:hypothetical protein n=1 Tax=Brachybacterium sp. GPGPB12 TaxID=3023517 RepID=UPI0031343129